MSHDKSKFMIHQSLVSIIFPVNENGEELLCRVFFSFFLFSRVCFSSDIFLRLRREKLHVKIE